MDNTDRKFAVLFDMDGLLIESEHLQSKSFEKVLARHGIKPEYNEVGTIQIAGITSKENFELIKKRHDIPVSAEELVRLKNEIYSEIIDEGIEPMPGAHKLVASLKDAGIKIAVASSSIPVDIEKVLRQIDLYHQFDAIVSGAEVERSKPAPDVFLEAARRLDMSPGSCVVLEDAEAGIKAGKSAGMKVIAVPNRFTSHNDFSQADEIVDSLEQLSAVKLRGLVFAA